MKIKIKNKEFELFTQQYEIGLYVCLYQDGRMVEQFGLDTTKEEFLKGLETNKDITIL